MNGTRRRLVAHALPALMLLLALSQHAWVLLAAARAVVWLLARAAQLVVVLAGSGSFWWVLRTYQLQLEQELRDQAWSKYNFYQRYRHRSSSGRTASDIGGGSASSTFVSTGSTMAAAPSGILDASGQLKSIKRLPVGAHLRTAWNLPPELCDELALVVQLALRDYVSYWFQPLSPTNDDFPTDLKLLLADLLGALTARVLEVDSSHALALAAHAVELLRLHLGWFREVYAQLEDDYPDAFQGGSDSDVSLRRRQELVAALAQKSPLLHPGCVVTSAPVPVPASNGATIPTTSPTTTTRKPAAESAEVVYLRHVAAQVLVQLKPELGDQYDASVCTSLVLHLLREATTFKVLKPLAEYAQQRYANELVLSLLQSFLAADKDSTAATAALSPVSGAPGGGVGGMTLQRLRLTKSFLYKATKRSSEQAEAAFQAVVDVVSSAAAASAVAATSEVVFDGDDWTDAAGYALGASLFGAPPTPNGAGSSSSTGGAAHERRQPFASLFSLDDRLSIPRAPRLKTPRAFLPGAVLSGNGPRSVAPANGSGATSGHIDDLKNIKANIGSSLNKVKRRFRTLSGHPQDQPGTPSTVGAGAGTGVAGNGVAFASTHAAARMMKKPGMLLQKALRRHDGPMTMMSPMSPTNSLDEVLTPPPLSDDDLFAAATVGGDESPSSESPSPTRAFAALSIDELIDGDGNTDDDVDVDVETVEGESPPKPAPTPEAVRVRVVQLLAKAVANYARMCTERPEMRSSARARELYDLLSALEDIFMLGFLDPVGDLTGDDPDDPDSPDSDDVVDVSGDDVLAQLAAMGATEGREQQYWHYLAQPRAETPFLTDHAQFVMRQCPPCAAPSDVFVSTRGVQWLLAALERGALWEFVTALHLDQRVTVQFYDARTAVLRDAALMESVLKSLAQLNALAGAFEIPHELGRRSDMDEVFGVLRAPPPATVTSRRRTSRGGDATSSAVAAVRILERVWEVERYVPIQGWTRAQDKRWHELPSSEWVWETDWTLELGAAQWEYAKTFEDRFHDKERKFDSVRRRKWVRRRRQLPPVLTASSSPIAIASPRARVRAVSHTGSNGRDSVSTLAAAGSTSVAPPPPSSPPALFGAASLPVAPVATVVTLGAGKVRNIKQFFDASKRGVGGGAKAKADDSAVNYASPSPPQRRFTKRRSNSFDKAMLSSPLADLMLASPSAAQAKAPAEAEAEALTPTSTHAVLPGQKKRRSIPSLRRANTSSEKDVKAALGLVRSTTTGSTPASTAQQLTLELDATGAGGTNNDDDDDSVCFCCLRPCDSADAALSTCESCQQRVCGACHAFAAFATLPPPLEASRKTRVCATCYERFTSRYRVRIGAHVSKYFRRDVTAAVMMESATAPDDVGSDSETAPAVSAAIASAPSRSAPPATFELVVFIEDEPAQAWSVVKRFADFEALEKQLGEKLRKQEKRHGAGCRGSHWKGVDYTELLDVAPSLRKLPVAALAYDQRLYVLEAFVQSLLASDTLCQSPVVHKFLQLGTATGCVASVSAPALSPALPAVAIGSDLPSGEPPLARAAGSTPNSSTSTSHGVLLLENGKWRKGKWVAPETSSKETKVRLLQKLEVSLFAVVGEVFEFDGIGVVRRQLFAMSRSFIKAFLSASHFRKLEKQFLSFTDPKRVAAAVVALRTYMFPDPDAPMTPAPVPLSALELQTLRKDTLEAIVASFPSTLVSLFGESSCETAALKLHEFLQHEVFVKNLLFSVADELLLHLFPDFVTFKPRATHTTQATHAIQVNK